MSAPGLATVVASEYYIPFDVGPLLSGLLGGPFRTKSKQKK